MSRAGVPLAGGRGAGPIGGTATGQPPAEEDAVRRLSWARAAGVAGATAGLSALGVAGAGIAAATTHAQAAASGRGTIYVTHVNGPSSVPFPYMDTVTPVKGGAVLPAVTVGDEPSAIAAAPNGKTVYVTNTGAGTVGRTVTPIRVATNKAGKAIKVGKSPVAIAITPNGRTAYVVNSGSASVTPIRAAANKAGKAIAVGKLPEAIVIAPNGKTAYVASQNAGTV